MPWTPWVAMPEEVASPEERVWGKLARELRAGRPVVLGVVVAHAGSSPGRTGFAVAVGVDGWLAGTTGGGVAEARVVDAARGLLADGGASVLLAQVHRARVPGASGLLCGGEQTVALEVLGPADAPRVDAVVAALARGDSAEFQVAGSAVTTVMVGPSHRVVVVGAGHVGEALASLLVGLGFRVEVVDERPGAAARLGSRAHRVRMRGYEALGEVVEPGERTFVVVATHAPERDVAAVRALAGVRVGYLGVVGTRRKLASLGAVAPDAEVPAGLPIGSHTPEEVALSIAARLVQLRSG